MRAALIVLTAAAVLAAAFFMLRDGERPGPFLDDTSIERRTADQAAPTTPEPAPDVAPPERVTPEPAEVPGPAPRESAPPPGRTESFHGEALLQHPGSRPVPASSGTIELMVLAGSYRALETAPVLAGQFEVEVPEIARVHITGGTLDGLTVRYLGVDRPFDPTGDRYVLVGEPVPVNVLVPLDALSGTPLAGIDLRVGESSTGARLVRNEATDSAPAVAALPRPILSDAASPITLPFVDSEHAEWIHLQKDGYAPATVLVDPRVPARREVRMWPSADLTLRLTGKDRTMARTIVLHREESGSRTSHAATFVIDAPEVERTTDAFVLHIEGLTALPHTVEIRGYDHRGRASKLATQRVELTAGSTAIETLMVEAP